MKKNLLLQALRLQFATLIVVLLLPVVGKAQWQTMSDQLDDPSVPAFVKAICAPKADVKHVAELYNQYYNAEIAPKKAAHQANPLTAGKKFKNEYEHLYKTWRSQTANYRTPDGFVDFSKEAEENRKELIERIHPEGVVSDRNVDKWVPYGPAVVFDEKSGKPISSQANVYDLARSRLHPNVMYAATESGGLFRSTDTGATWKHIGDDQNFRWVQAVAVGETLNNGIVFIGVPGKIMSSGDAGETWNEHFIQPSGIPGDDIPDNYQTYQIIHSIHDGNYLYAATSAGSFVSDDFGSNWKENIGLSAFGGGRVTSIAEHPTNPNYLYCLVYLPSSKSTVFCRSEDQGASWAIFTDGWFDIPTADEGKLNIWGGRIVVTPAAPNRVYVMLNEADSHASANLKLDGFVGIYCSDNSGVNWTRKTNYLGRPYNLTDRPNLVSWGHNGYEPLPDQYKYNQASSLNNAIYASHIDADHLYVGGLSMWESTDGGSTWQVRGGYNGNVPHIHPDIRRFVGKATSATTEELFWSSDGGINYSSNGTLASHEARNLGIYANELWGFDMDKRQFLFGGGSYHNGNNVWNGQYGFNGGGWKHAGGGESATGFAQYGAEPKMWFVDQPNLGNALPNDESGAITPYSSILDQAAWKPNLSLDYRQNRASRILFDKNNPRIIFWGHDGKFCRSEDDGKTAKVLFDFGGTKRIEWFEQSPLNGDYMYLKTEDTQTGNFGFHRSDNRGRTWTTVIQSMPSNYIFTVAGDQLIYRSDENGNDNTKILVSGDGGSNWNPLIEPQLNGFRVLSLLSITGSKYYLVVATDKGGVFRFSNAGIENISNGLFPVIEAERLLYLYSEQTLVMGTNGLGVWVRPWEDGNDDYLSAQFASDYDKNWCVGSPVHFHNRSSDAGNSDYSWTFTGGTPNSSTDENPVVTYDTPGTWPVYLDIVDQNSGFSSFTGIAGFITIVPRGNYPIGETFEGGVLSGEWLLTDANNNGNNWQIASNIGGFGTSQHSLVFDNYNLDEAGSKDEIRPFGVHLVNSTAATLSFDVAYTMFSGDPNGRDSLEVLVSTDCGKTFTRVFLNGGEGLSTAPPAGVAFIPTANQWQQKTVNLAQFLGNYDVLLAFRNIGHYGNRMFLDNINVTGTLVGTDEEIIEQSLIVSPNPNGGVFRVKFEVPETLDGTLSLTDPLGREVYRTAIQGVEGKFEEQITVENLSSGLYLLRVQGESVEIVHKILIQH
ncbi:MAG: T9SS type A sorting domain-containing protein [Lewinellaceae bacterium]|nr:T9SS type A sorting domain-containing protein [Lewinellaceae bacterium]